MSMSRMSSLLVLLTLTLVTFAQRVEGAPIVYTFEAPGFVSGSTTPFLNKTPNVGDPTFTASFTSAPTAAGFMVVTNPLNPLMTGQILQDPASPADVLTVSMNMFVSSVTLDFAIFEPGLLRLTTPSETTSFASANVGGAFQGGTITFNGALPFNTFSLLALNNAGAPTLFAIDDLTLDATVVPEPATLSLLSLGLLPVVRRRLRSRG